MIDSDNISLVTDEWKLYRAEQIDDKLWKTEDEDRQTIQKNRLLLEGCTFNVKCRWYSQNMQL